MSYNFYSQIVVDKDLVGETDANFAVLINGIYDGTGGEPDLRTIGNGGNVQNTASGGASGAYTVPADLVFSPNTNGASPYDFEIEKYNAATGEIVAWVQCGVNSGADVTFYMVYGDNTVVTSQENVAGTWDATFEMVQHMPDATTSTIVDSTDNNNDGTKKATNEPLEESGQIGYGQYFGGDNYVTADDNAGLSITGDLTIETWVRSDTIASSQALVGKYDSPGVQRSYTFYLDPTGKPLFAVSITLNPFTGAVRTASIDVDDNVWHHLVAVFDANLSIHIYIDGALRDGTLDGTVPAAIADSPRDLAIGASYSNSTTPNAIFLIGYMDEVRISNTTRTPDYITTCYNNQSDPTSFYSAGAEQSFPRNPVIIFQDPGIL